jgi:secreted repeat protein with Y-X4-D motif
MAGGVLVTSKVTKSGTRISGNTVHIVVVKVGPGYAPNPGSHAVGTIVPLYTYSRDTAPGQINGQAVHAFGGTWLVVPASGKATGQHGPTPTASSGGTGV